MSFRRVTGFKQADKRDENTPIMCGAPPEVLELTATEMDEVCGAGELRHPRQHIYRVIREVRVVRVYRVLRKDFDWDY